MIAGLSDSKVLLCHPDILGDWENLKSGIMGEQADQSTNVSAAEVMC